MPGPGVPEGAGAPCRGEGAGFSPGDGGVAKGGSSDLGDGKGWRDLEELVVGREGLVGPSPERVKVLRMVLGWVREKERPQAWAGVRGRCLRGLAEISSEIFLQLWLWAWLALAGREN